MTDTHGKSAGNTTTTSPTASAIAAHFDRARTRPKVGFEDDSNAYLQTTLVVDGHDLPQPNQNSAVPQWQRELANSRVGRHSRASSIFSTRTRLTVMSDDAKSVEFQAGGQLFRISRDGSSVTDITAPPPYPGQSLNELLEESDEDTSLGDLRPEEEEEDPQSPSLSDSAVTERGSPTLHSHPLRTHKPEGAVVNEGAADDIQRMSSSQVLEFPRKLRNMFSLNWSGLAITVANPTESITAGALRRTQSDTSNHLNGQEPFLQVPTILPKKIKSHQSRQSLPDLPMRQESSLVDDAESEAMLFGEDDVEGAAEISKYYNRIIVDMDRDYRKKLHERDNELSQLRELRNNMDIVYRQQLRDRDNQIDMLQSHLMHANNNINQLKTQMYDREKGFDRQIEQARHEVEEIWETRWKDYERLLLSGPDRKIISRNSSISQKNIANDQGDEEARRPVSTEKDE